MSEDQTANPNPGPSVFHDFDCKHNPCRCQPARIDAYDPATGLWSPAVPLPFYIGPLARLRNVVLRRKPAPHSGEHRGGASTDPATG